MFVSFVCKITHFCPKDKKSALEICDLQRLQYIGKGPGPASISPFLVLQTNFGRLLFRFFFNFNTFSKLILTLTLSVFFKTNTFGRAYFPGAAKCLCHAMHGGAAGS